LPLDYFTDYSGGAMFALARAKEAEPGPPQLGALMKLRRFDRCALNAIVAYRSYAGHGSERRKNHRAGVFFVMNECLLSSLLICKQQIDGLFLSNFWSLTPCRFLSSGRNLCSSHGTSLVAA